MTSLGPTYIEADTYETGERIRFLRGGFVVSEFPAISVKEVAEVSNQGGGSLFTGETPDG